MLHSSCFVSRLASIIVPPLCSGYPPDEHAPAEACGPDRQRVAGVTHATAR